MFREPQKSVAPASTQVAMREPLLTNRLVLRDITEADAELLFDLDSDPEVMRYIGPRAAPDVAGYCDRTRTVYMPLQAHPWHGFRIVLDRATDEFLGWVFARPSTDSKFAREIGWTRADEVEVGYRYRRSAWGRGGGAGAAPPPHPRAPPAPPLVRIARADPATSAVVACALAGNAGSLRVLAKLGLARVGEVTLSETIEPTVKLALVK
jgi:RimJ/RimL family protein N-acetyltransferase